MKSNGRRRRVNGRTPRDMEGEGEKAMDANMDGSPGYQSQSQ